MISALFEGAREEGKKIVTMRRRELSAELSAAKSTRSRATKDGKHFRHFFMIFFSLFFPLFTITLPPFYASHGPDTTRYSN